MPNTHPDTPQAGSWDRLQTLPAVDSTQTELLARLQTDPQAWPHLSALRALHQRAGRGRAAHSWDTPPTGALTFSAVLRPCVPAQQLPWLPLIAGLAVRDAVAEVAAGSNLGWETGVKWPNDVVVRPTESGARWEQQPGWGQWRKLAGILTDLVSTPTGGAVREESLVVVGIGVNIGQSQAELPVPWGCSLHTLGLETSAEALLDGIGRQLRRRITQWEDGGDPAESSLGEELRAACWSLGQNIVASTPAGQVAGRAVDLTPALLLDTPAGQYELTAGDTTIRDS